MAVVVGIASIGGLTARRNSIADLFIVSEYGNGEGGRVTPRYRLWVVFSPANCKLTARQIKQLNAVNREGHLRVVALVLDPPTDSLERSAVLQSFGIEFPLLLDREGRWKRELQLHGLEAPLVVLQQSHRILVIASMSALGTLEQLPLALEP